MSSDAECGSCSQVQFTVASHLPFEQEKPVLSRDFGEFIVQFGVPVSWHALRSAVQPRDPLVNVMDFYNGTCEIRARHSLGENQK